MVCAKPSLRWWCLMVADELSSCYRARVCTGGSIVGDGTGVSIVAGVPSRIEAVEHKSGDAVFGCWVARVSDLGLWASVYSHQDGGGLEMNLNGGSSRAEEDDFEFSEHQMSKIKKNEEISEKREKEIQQVVESVNEQNI
ncbi:hypothetical protein IGI04_035165 [Brassica rapa subsp. trilocularis]|uniref:Uncharacterized protein n=1 Tax=Brassica rapa subsp. trilocularis TaxID=1813537 RepID=A0ABQ7LDK8_BRACM|nr:hypothetical protein IGI04_035165 [Brassica rapa subsp. trilocularis]